MSKENMEVKSIDKFANTCVKNAFEPEKLQKRISNEELDDVFSNDRNNEIFIPQNSSIDAQSKLKSNSNNEECVQHDHNEEISDNYDMEKPTLDVTDNTNYKRNTSSFPMFGIVIFLLSLFLGFIVLLNPFNDKTSRTMSKELKACKVNLRRLRLLNRKLLKKINKRICA